MPSVVFEDLTDSGVGDGDGFDLGHGGGFAVFVRDDEFGTEVAEDLREDAGYQGGYEGAAGGAAGIV